MSKPKTWHDVMSNEEKNAYFIKILTFLRQERATGKIIYPPESDVFNAFRFTKFEDVKVVLLGQDPYHGSNQAHGLCFSVLPDVKPPPSLVNIYKELAQDFPNFSIPEHGYLKSWAEQGVLMLNTVLTVEQGQAHSHSKIGWEIYTDKMIEAVNLHKEGVVFLLWGAHAQKKGRMIDKNKHHVLTAPHPSPLSAHRGFFGCKHFSQTNQLLERQGANPINWQPQT